MKFDDWLFLAAFLGFLGCNVGSSRGFCWGDSGRPAARVARGGRLVSLTGDEPFALTDEEPFSLTGENIFQH